MYKKNFKNKNVNTKLKNNKDSNNNIEKRNNNTLNNRKFLEHYNIKSNSKIKIIPLGGLSEIGMNITLKLSKKEYK